MKLIILVLGLVVGFGVGVWWGVNHPAQAQQLSTAEERKFLQAQIKVTEAARDQLDRLIASHASQGSAAPAAPGPGFLSSSPTPSTDTSAMIRMRDQQQKQLDDLHARLDALNAQ